MIQHGDVEVGERRVVVVVKTDVATVLEAAAGEEDREVAGVVRVRVAEVAAEEDRGLIQQRAVSLAASLELPEKAAEALDDLPLDLPQLRDLVRILTVVREVVVRPRDARNLRHFPQLLNHYGDDARRIGLQNQRYEVHQQLDAANEVAAFPDVDRGLAVHPRLGPLEPGLGLGDAFFGRAHSLEVRVQPASIGGAGAPVERLSLPHQAVEDAASVAEIPLLPLDLVGIPREEHPGEEIGGTGL